MVILLQKKTLRHPNYLHYSGISVQHTEVLNKVAFKQEDDMSCLQNLESQKD